MQNRSFGFARETLEAATASGFSPGMRRVGLELLKPGTARAGFDNKMSRRPSGKTAATRA
ncbi:hypothetical protein amrb99_63060 [Actinomadura sp. RB99]|nr:hypothetical protein [Actinomadura sp. RB99]